MPPAKTNGHGSLAEALVAAQAEMPSVAKTATNPHFKNKFAPLDKVLEAVLPVLNTHGLALVQRPTTIDGQPALTTMLIHESGESIEDTMLLLPGKLDPQGQGASLTYARRFAAASFLSLVIDEDDDGNSASRTNGQAARQTAAATNGTKAPTPLVAQIEALIDQINRDGSLTEAQIRDGMKLAYGTEVTAELTASQAGEFLARLTAKAPA